MCGDVTMLTGTIPMPGWTLPMESQDLLPVLQPPLPCYFSFGPACTYASLTTGVSRRVQMHVDPAGHLPVTQKMACVTDDVSKAIYLAGVLTWSWLATA